MAYRVKGRYTYRPSDYIYFVTQDSQTVPGDALSLRELLIRFTKGLPPPGTERDVEYDDTRDLSMAQMMRDKIDDDVHPSIRVNADLTDYDDYKDELRNLAQIEVQKSARRRAARVKKEVQKPAPKPAEDNKET